MLSRRNQVIEKTERRSEMLHTRLTRWRRRLTEASFQAIPVNQIVNLESARQDRADLVDCVLCIRGPGSGLRCLGFFVRLCCLPRRFRFPLLIPHGTLQFRFPLDHRSVTATDHSVLVQAAMFYLDDVHGLPVSRGLLRDLGPSSAGNAPDSSSYKRPLVASGA